MPPSSSGPASRRSRPRWSAASTRSRGGAATSSPPVARSPHVQAGDRPVVHGRRPEPGPVSAGGRVPGLKPWPPGLTTSAPAVDMPPQRCTSFPRLTEYHRENRDNLDMSPSQPLSPHDRDGESSPRLRKFKPLDLKMSVLFFSFFQGGYRKERPPNIIRPRPGETGGLLGGRREPAGREAAPDLRCLLHLFEGDLYFVSLFQVLTRLECNFLYPV